MTSFQEKLKQHIFTNGPIPLEKVMALSNHHYYTHYPVFGADGDFLTAPEISQVFGEILAIWVIVQAKKLKTKTPHIVELGPGRGTLMADITRVLRIQKNCHPTIHLVETSKRLITRQHEHLSPSPFPLLWHSDFPLLDGPTIIIANEFFDALPVKRYIFKEGQWQEIYLDCEAEQFTYTHKPTPTNNLPVLAEEGAIFELSQATLDYARQLAQLLKRNGGSALIIDYGDYISTNRFSDTFQALSRHKPVHPLHHLGEADLTCHVDFARLAAVFHEQELSCSISMQSDFLKAYGFHIRLRKIIQACTNEAHKEDQRLRGDRLTNPKEMGTLFKVLEVTS